MDAICFPDRNPAAPTALATALAYDRRHANRRAVFALRHALTPAADGRWRLQRQWQGVGAEPLGEETVCWDPRRGLLAVEAHWPSLGEVLTARRAPGGDPTRPTFDTVRVPAHGAHPVARRLVLPRRAFSLASAPLEIAAAWPALLRGERLRRQFLVLKVQRHAAVDLQRIAAGPRQVAIALTPVALPLRWLFGRTVFHFAGERPALVAIDGLLDPRDRRRNGRWHEYLGRIAFDAPVDFAAVATDVADAGHAR